MAIPVKKTSGQLEVERTRERNRLAAERNKIVIKDFTVCYFCKTKGLSEADAFCPNCGFPQRGTEEQQKKYVGDHMVQKIRLDEMGDAIIKARNMLFTISALTLIPYLIASIKTGEVVVFLIGIFVALLYAGLALWSRTQPFSAILTGMILYVSLWALYTIINPINFFSGILYKIMGLTALYYGYNAARNYDKMKKQVDLKNNPIDLETPVPDEPQSGATL
ncbi:MAG TPA: hypothetical protein VGO45_08820 [Bacteroidia bacterium]|jgi:uncharacterized membrane protein|nr:hypothetical protein [Bacteroidia bacterium]